MNAPSRAAVEEKIAAILRSKKYRGLDIPHETLWNLFEEELAGGLSLKRADDQVRTRLHNIMAPYLGDPDYAASAALISEAARSGDPGQMKAACAGILETHASTRERLPVLDEFYGRIFEKTGRPGTILDLACGLNPLAFPWMGLPPATRYFAYDIHGPRVDLINHFFESQGLAPLATRQDILVRPPDEEADVAFLFKEAHRIEQRRRGANLSLWQALRVSRLLVSLPASSLSGKFDLAGRQRALVYGILEGLPWRVEEILVDNELIFFIEKI